MGKYAIRRMVLKAGSRLKRVRETADVQSPDALFIWIPKTAGTSIYTLFRQMGMGKYKSLDRARHLFPGHGLATFVHQSVPSLIEAGAIKQEYVQEACKFSFLRNPYDRAVSLYHYFHRFQRLCDDVCFPKFLTILEEEWHKNQFLKIPTEKELTDRVCYRGELIFQNEHTLYPVGPYNVLGWSQCRPQTEWLTGMGDLSEIHLGRMENIDEDCKSIIGKIFSSSPELYEQALEYYGDSVPKANTTPHKDYREHYKKDPALGRIVETIYQSDFETFGY